MPDQGIVAQQDRRYEGPLTAKRRHDISVLLYRGVAGAVPAKSGQVVLTLTCVL